MDLQTFLIANVERIGIETCAKMSGYSVIANGVRHIQTLLDEPFCGEMGSQSVQDWHHTDSTLLHALCALFECPPELIDKNRYAVECILKDRERAAYRHIKAIPEKYNVHSWAEAVGYDHFTLIRNLHALNQYDFKHQLERVSRIVKEHYLKHNKNSRFGAILSYNYYYESGKKPVKFDVEGNVISETNEK